MTTCLNGAPSRWKRPVTAVRSPIAMKDDSAAATMVETTWGRARVGLAFIVVSLRSCFGRESLLLLGRTFLLASRFSPLAGLKRSEGADVGINSRQSLPDVPLPPFLP